jgi:hypothetical protein
MRKRERERDKSLKFFVIMETKKNHFFVLLVRKLKEKRRNVGKILKSISDLRQCLHNSIK